MGLVLEGTALSIFPTFVEEAAALVVADFVPEVGRAIFGGSKLSPQNSIPIQGTIDGADTQRRIFLSRVGHVHTDTLVGSTGLGLADHDFFDITVLAEELGATERVQQGLFIFEGWDQANDIDQVLLFDAHTGEVSTRRVFDFSLFGLLSLGGSLLFVLV